MSKAVILNDTRGDNHFGCFRVMRVIEDNLATRGITVTGRSLVRNDWQQDHAFLAHLSGADLIVVNGEGTLHHGNRQGERLLEITEHPARKDKPIALINTIYQDNPDTWKKWLGRIDLISTRDSKSAAEIATLTGKPCGFVPDLSLAEGSVAMPNNMARTRLLIGDSVDRKTTQSLLRLAEMHSGAKFLPITKALKPSKPHYSAVPRALREAYIELHATIAGWRRGNIEFNRDETGFIHSLQTAQLHVTGRFHAVCFCLFTGTPFFAVESNSWKMGALLEDFGLGTDRIMPIATIEARLASGDDAAFSDDEKTKIATGLERCTRGTIELFDRIAALPGKGLR